MEWREWNHEMEWFDLDMEECEQMEWKECCHEVEDLCMLMCEMEWKEECVWYMKCLDLDQEGDYEMDYEG